MEQGAAGGAAWLRSGSDCQDRRHARGKPTGGKPKRSNGQAIDIRRDANGVPEGLLRYRFAESGPLGIVFGDVAVVATGESVVAVSSVRPGSVASLHVGLAQGLVLEEVQGASVCGESFDAVLGRIKRAGRPLELAFRVPEPEPEPEPEPS